MLILGRGISLRFPSFVFSLYDLRPYKLLIKKLFNLKYYLISMPVNSICPTCGNRSMPLNKCYICFYKKKYYNAFTISISVIFIWILFFIVLLIFPNPSKEFAQVGCLSLIIIAVLLLFFLYVAEHAHLNNHKSFT